MGFQSTTSPTLTVQVLGTVANNYQIINRADVGGKYQGTWQTGQASWVTVVRKLTPNPTLPRRAIDPSQGAVLEKRAAPILIFMR